MSPEMHDNLASQHLEPKNAPLSPHYSGPQLGVVGSLRGAPARLLSLSLSLSLGAESPRLLHPLCVLWHTSHLQRGARSDFTGLPLHCGLGYLMGADLHAMAPSHPRRQHHPPRQNHRGSPSLVLAAAATLAFGLPHLGRASLPHIQTRSTPRQAFCAHSLRCHPQRRCRAAPASSPKAQQQEGGDERLFLSPDDTDENGRGAGEAVTIAATGLPSVQDEDDSTEEQPKRSRWSWGRKKKESQDEGGGLFSYDWENGDRVVWKTSKKSKADVVSRASFDLFFSVILFTRVCCINSVTSRGASIVCVIQSKLIYPYRRSHRYPTPFRYHDPSPPLQPYPPYNQTRCPICHTGRIKYHTP